MGRLLFISYKILEFFSVACKNRSRRSCCFLQEIGRLFYMIEKHKVVLNNLSVKNQQVGLFISIRNFQARNSSIKNPFTSD